ncbi:MAG: hypothetical protein ACOVQX_03990 [Legionella sp.]
MPKVVFFFGGTGETGEQMALSKESGSIFNPDVIRIYIKGCQHPKVGGALSLEGLRPDLDVVAHHIRNAFTGNNLDLNKLRKNFGDHRDRHEIEISINHGQEQIESTPSDSSGIYSIVRSVNLNQSETFEIDEIMLEGFSRGGVSAFATAKQLDDLDIPINIIANQPVPGGLGKNDRLFTDYHDLSHCRNIKTAITLLITQNLENSAIQNIFFHQMMARFSPTTKVTHYLLPHQEHLEWFDSDLIPCHIDHHLITTGFAEGLASKDKIINWYNQHDDFYFTPVELRQPILGKTDDLTLDPFYLEAINTHLKSFYNQESNPLVKLLVLEREEFLKLFKIEQEFLVRHPTMRPLLIALSPGNREKMYQLLKGIDTSRIANVAEFDAKIITILTDKQDRRAIHNNSSLFLAMPTENLHSLHQLSDNDKMQFVKKITEERKQFHEIAYMKKEGILHSFDHQNDHFKLPQALKDKLSQVVNNETLATEQKMALLSISKLNAPIEQKEKMYNLALADGPQAIKFCQIIDKTTEMCHYLGNQIKLNDTTKGDLMLKHAETYKIRLFIACETVITSAENDAHAVEQFTKDISFAHREFKHHATGIHRNSISYVIEYLANFIIHTLGKLFASLRKYQDNNRFETRSVQLTRNMRDHLLDMINTSDTSNDNRNTLAGNKT